MRQLAIECASEACSIALFDNSALIANAHQELGRGHAERLIPLIAELPDKGKSERILVSLGPGSFTGVRIGIAAARALGFAWDAPVLGYPTLALVAATARTSHPDQAITSCMNGGHGEWFVQDFGPDGIPENALTALPIKDAMQRKVHPIVAGNRAHERCENSSLTPLHLLPDARHVWTIPDELITQDLTPLYGRAPDAALPASTK